MSLSGHLTKGQVLIWTTEITLDARNTSRESPVFKFLGFEWNLMWKCYTDSIFYYLYLKIREPALSFNPFHVDCCVANQDEERWNFISCKRTKIECYSQSIFVYSPTTEREITDFCSHGKLDFVLIFSGVDERIYLNSQTNITDKSIQTNLDLELENLSQSLSSLLENEDLPDVQLKCGDCVLPAHKSVLAARSSVFLAMFRNRMKEQSTGVVDIPDVEIPVLKLFLKALYSGKFPDTSNAMVSKLYAVCDKYAILSLRKLCSDRMVNFLSEDNYQNYLLLADAHNDHDFRSSVGSFICNHAQILKLDSWLNFSEQHPKLANVVYRMHLETLDLTAKSPKEK